MADVTRGRWLECVPEGRKGLKLSWFAMDETRGRERNGARMKKVMETKKARERRTCDGLRRARLDCCTACCKLANRKGDRDESCCVSGVLRLSEKQQLEACRCSASEGTITPNADTALHFPQRPSPASDLAVPR